MLSELVLLAERPDASVVGYLTQMVILNLLYIFILLVTDSPFTHLAVCVMHSTQQSFPSPKPKCEAESHNSGGYPKNI